MTIFKRFGPIQRGLVASLPLVAVAAMATAGGQQRRLVLNVDGLACPFCAYGLEKKLQRIEGVERLDIDINKGLVALDIKDDVTIDDRLLDQLETKTREAGFTARQVTIETVSAVEAITFDRGTKPEATRLISMDITAAPTKGSVGQLVETLAGKACVRRVIVNMSSQVVEVACTDRATSPQQFVEAVERLGYQVTLRTESANK